MTAGKYDIVIEAGATFSETWTWTSGGSAVNLTGYSARLKLAAAPGETAVLSLTESSGITLGGVAGTIAVVMTAAQTAALGMDRGVWALELQTGSTVTRLLEGAFRVSSEVVT